MITMALSASKLFVQKLKIEAFLLINNNISFQY